MLMRRGASLFMVNDCQQTRQGMLTELARVSIADQIVEPNIPRSCKTCAVLSGALRDHNNRPLELTLRFSVAELCRSVRAAHGARKLPQFGQIPLVCRADSCGAASHGFRFH